MPRPVRVLLAVLVPTAALGALWWYGTRPEPVTVRLIPVERGIVESTVANTRAGTVRARRRAKLAPAIGGEVAVLAVDEGDRVTTGQLLLSLWNDDLKASLRQAEAELEQARAQCDQASRLAQNSEREAERLRELLAASIASPEEVDSAVTTAEAARAAARAADARIRVTEAQIAVIDAQLARTELHAPFDGIVAEVNAELGEYATPSPPGIPTLPAIDLIDDGSIDVRAPIDEVDAPAIRVGQAARITLDAFQGRTFPARVTRIAPYVLDREKQARTVDVEVVWEPRPTDVLLIAGYSADVEIVLDSHDGVLRVPTEAVFDGDRVLTLDPVSGTLVERRIRPGLANWHFTEVLDGLAEGDRVVATLGREGVRAGALAKAEGEATR